MKIFYATCGRGAAGVSVWANCPRPLFVFFIFCMLCFSQVYATTTNWTGNTSTAWSNPANWDNGVPTSSVDAVINTANYTGGNNQPSLDNTGLTCKTLTLSGTAVLSGSSGYDLTVSGSVTIGASASLAAGASGITVSGGTFTISGSFSASGICSFSSNTITDNGTFTSTGDVYLNGCTISGSATVPFYRLHLSGGVNTLHTSITVSDTFDMGFAGLVPDATVTIGGTGVLTGTVSALAYVKKTGANDNLRNQYTIATIDASNLSFEYEGAGAQQVNAGTYGSIGINNYSTVDFAGDITILTDLAYSNTTINANSYNLYLGGFLYAGLNGVFSAGTGTLIMNGTSSFQIISQSTLNNLIIDNTGGGVIDNGSTINGTLTLTSGVLSENSNKTLTLASINISGGNDTSYIDAPVKNTTLSPSNSSCFFPLGNSGRYAPIMISSITSAATFTTRYFKSAHSASVSGIAGAPVASDQEYWTLVENSGTSTADVTLYWRDAASSGISTGGVSSVTVYNDHGGSTWVDLGGTPTGTGGTGGSGSVTTTSVPASDFSGGGYFTFGDNSSGNPLPVTFLDFEVSQNNGDVALTWVTASEQNNAYFIIERSADGIAWYVIGQAPGHCTTSEKHTYTAADRLPFNATVMYYRLKQVDFNGAVHYSEIRKAVSGSISKSIDIYPNPAGSSIRIDLPDPGNMTYIEIIRLSGAKVYSAGVSAADYFSKTIDISAFPAGAYMVKYFTEKGVQAKTFIKQ